MAPSKKQRHEKLDLTDLIRKSEEQYVDFQQAGKNVGFSHESRIVTLQHQIKSNQIMFTSFVHVTVKSSLLHLVCFFKYVQIRSYSSAYIITDTDTCTDPGGLPSSKVASDWILSDYLLFSCAEVVLC